MTLLWESKMKDLKLYHYLTYTHSINVAYLTWLISEELGFPPGQRNKLFIGACLHDIGKFTVPLYILNKPAALSYTEWQLIKEHTQWGSEAMSKGDDVVDEDILDIIRLHHERWDGGGYYGLTGEKIPLAARIVGIADAVDAMTQKRPYQIQKTKEQCIEEIKRYAGKQFDPYLGEITIKILSRTWSKIWIAGVN